MLRRLKYARAEQEHVRLLGFLPDDQLPLAYRAADVSVLPSLAMEGFGLSAAESLAAGTPVLVSRVGGLPEVVAGLDANLLLDSTEPQVIARHIVQFLNAPKKFPDAAACRSHAVKHFAWSVVAEQVRDVHASCLN